MVRKAIGRVTIIGRGHAAITASHAKTVELVSEQEIGPRATCVVAVGARVESGDLLELRGWIDLTLEAGGITDVIRGHANPASARGDRLVVRRGAAAVRDALLVEADKGAADLDRRLVAALTDPQATVTVRLAPAQDQRRGRGALIVSPGAPWTGSTSEPSRPAEVNLRSPLSAQDVELATSSLVDSAHVSLDANLAADRAALALVEAAWSEGHFVLAAEGLGPLPSALAVAGVDLSNVSRSRPACTGSPPGLDRTRCHLRRCGGPVGRGGTSDRRDREGDPERPGRGRARRGDGQHARHAVAGAGRIDRALAARTRRDRRGRAKREHVGWQQRRGPPPLHRGPGRGAGGSRRIDARGLRCASARDGHVAKGGLRSRARARRARTPSPGSPPRRSCCGSSRGPAAGPRWCDAPAPPPARGDAS